MIFLKLAAIFFKTGLFTIGGGLAALPLLHRYLVSGGWVTQAEFIDMIAVSQSTPGPIGINMATYAGFKAAALPGALVATAAMVAPSLVIIMLIARFLRDYAHLDCVRDMLSGLRPAAVGLIGAATWFILSHAVLDADRFPAAGWLDIRALALFCVLGLCYRRWKGYPVYYIVAGAVAGMLFM